MSDETSTPSVPPIAQQWFEWQAHFLSPNLTVQARQLVRRAFYAGAGSMEPLIRYLGSAEVDPEAKADQLSATGLELATFIQAMRDGEA